jgi:hypothetical protein
LIPSTMTDWENGPPPPKLRLPIDEELMLLAGRRRSPAVRSDSAILAEFPGLNWDGPYRASRLFLFAFSISFRMDEAAYLRKIIREIKTHSNLLSEIRKSICAYIDEVGHPLARAIAESW